jgi:hypothetical protein
MFRSLLFLLLALTQLLPQGVCLCGFAAATCAASKDGNGGQATAHASCCHHGRDSSAGQSGPLSNQGGDNNQRVPADNHDQHAPGCPALRPACGLRVAPDTMTYHSPGALAFAGWLLDPDTLLRHTPFAGPLSERSSISHPLYLTLRTLLI